MSDDPLLHCEEDPLCPAEEDEGIQDSPDVGGKDANLDSVIPIESEGVLSSSGFLDAIFPISFGINGCVLALLVHAPKSSSDTSESESFTNATDFWNQKKADGWIYPIKREDVQRHGEGGGDFNASRSKGSRSHAGVDIFARPGVKVYAMTNGTVVSRIVTKIEVDKNGKEKVKGFMGEVGTDALVVKNDDGTWVRYGEIDIIKVNGKKLWKGVKIEKGQVIGTVDKHYDHPDYEDPRKTHYMLHLEVYFGFDKDGAPVGGFLTNEVNTEYYYESPQYPEKAKQTFCRRADIINPDEVDILPDVNGK